MLMGIFPLLLIHTILKGYMNAYINPVLTMSCIMNI